MDVAFHYFSDKKVANIRASTSSAAPLEFVKTNCVFLGFQPVSPDDVAATVGGLPSKQCATDPIPTWLLKECADDLALFLCRLFNRSLQLGVVPAAFVSAYISGWSSGSGYMALNHWRPCSCRRWSTCLEQSSSRSAPIRVTFYFQNTPEVTSVQHIIPLSLTVSLTIFCTEPLKPLVLHTPLYIYHYYVTLHGVKCNSVGGGCQQKVLWVLICCLLSCCSLPRCCPAAGRLCLLSLVTCVISDNDIFAQ